MSFVTHLRGLMSRRRYLAMGSVVGLGAGAAVLGRPRSAAAAESGPSGPGFGRGLGGIQWPSGQALPVFAAPRSLEVVDLSGVTADEQLLLTTLQGVVNSTEPRIYLLHPGDAEASEWLDELGVPFQQLAHPLDALSRYRSEVRGAVVHDPAVPATVNVATTLAGLSKAVATSADVAATAGLPVVTDLRGRFANDLAAYTWAADTLWPGASHRMLVGLAPGITGHLRDYAVANGAMVVDLDPAVGGERALLTRLLSDLPAASPLLGVWPNDSAEDDFVQLAAEHGVYVLAADWCTNLTVFSGAAAPVSTQQPTPPVPPLENKVYVTLTMTDGDNLQYAQHRMREAWDDPDRGSAPLNWTTQPLLVDAAPLFLSHYQSSATVNDYLMAGPSGAGYTYPSDWPADALGAFIDLTASYTARAGLPTQCILNRRNRADVPLEQSIMTRYTRDVQPLGLLMSWTSHTSTTVVCGDTPLSVSYLASTADDATKAVTRAATGWDGSHPLFVSIGLLAWSMGPADAATITRALGSDDYRVVRGDHYFALARQAFGLPAVGRNR
jgi:hypothetical protein